jgi:hypothetical protein
MRKNLAGRHVVFVVVVLVSMFRTKTLEITLWYVVVLVLLQVFRESSLSCHRHTHIGDV